MSTSSSEEGSWMAGHRATSFDLESTGMPLSSLPSDSSDVQTEVTPPTSPAPSEDKMRTPRDFLDASRRLGRISAVALKVDSGVTPIKPPKQFHHRALHGSVANDEAGYDADGDGDRDGDGDGDGDEGSRASASTSATTRPIRRPAFPRVDTRQHRRVASLLATRCPRSPVRGFEDVYVRRPPRAKLVALPAIHLNPAAAPKVNAESYELRHRPRAEPVGLGIGFPENHPLRSRSFSMPLHSSVSPISDRGELGEEVRRWVEEQGPGRGRRSEWQVLSKKKMTEMGLYAPSPVRLALQPTSLEVPTSPIKCSTSRSGAGMFHCDETQGERYLALAHEGRPESDPF